MNRDMFDESLTALLYFKNIPVSETHTEYLFNMMKDDFTDDEFRGMCMDICKTEELYNKYPDPKLFYDRKKESQKTILVEYGSFFLDDTMTEYKEHLIGVSDEQQQAIAEWIMKNKRGEMVSTQWVIDRIKQFTHKEEQAEAITLSEIKKLIAGNKEEQ